MHQFPELSELGTLRRAAGWTQRKLALEVCRAGFSLHQPQVSRIEKGDKDDPVQMNYRAAVTAFRLLESEIELQQKGDKRLASDVMTPREEMLTVPTTARIDEITPKMAGSDISQVPVMTGELVVGLLTDKRLLLQSGQTLVRDCMDASPPNVSADMPVREVAILLKKNQAVLLQTRGVLVGIMTAQDALPT